MTALGALNQIETPIPKLETMVTDKTEINLTMKMWTDKMKTNFGVNQIQYRNQGGIEDMCHQKSSRFKSITHKRIEWLNSL
jgi:hypothetical protein